MRRTLLTGVLLIGLVAGLSCTSEKSAGPVVPTRPYVMGFSFYPTVFQSAEPNQFIANATSRSDLITIHWDGNVPWPLVWYCPDLDDCESLGDPTLIAMRDNFRQTIAGLKIYTEKYRADPNKRVYLALSPLSTDRTIIAHTYAGEDATPPGTSFSHPDVRSTYVRFARYMTEQFMPDFVSPVIEMNMYVASRPHDLDALVSLAKECRDSLHRDDPTLLVAPTLQWEFYRDEWQAPSTRPFIDDMLSSYGDVADFYAFSTYPNVFLDHTTVDLDWYRFNDYGFSITEQTPLMISECGVQPSLQQEMLRTLSQVLEAHKAIALDYFFLEDMDHLPFPPAFENVGLYDDSQSPTLVPHPGLDVWDSLFAL